MTPEKHDDNLARAVEQIRNQPTPAGPSDQLLQETLNKLAAAGPTTKKPDVERIRLMKTITKLAVAAVVILATILGVTFVNRTGSIALADVYSRVQQAQAFMYKMSMTMTGSMMEGTPKGTQEMEVTVVVSNQYGMKWDNTMHMVEQNKTIKQQMYVIPDEKVILMIMPEEKKYMRMEFADDLLERMKKQNNDPRTTIKQMLGCKYTELGRREINGIPVQGFGTTDPAYSGGVGAVDVSLWVDLKTWMPVRCELSMTMTTDMEMHGVISDFQWDIPVDASEFKPVIPADYKEFGSMKLPAMNEESAVKGLQLFAELAGKYPTKIDMMNLMKETGALRNSQTEAAKQFGQQLKTAATEDEKGQMIMQKMMPLQSLGMFYMTLVQDKKDPAYYGQTVTPGDAQAVLLRWKESEDSYKVIFGDLSVTEMSAEQLKQIEPAVQEQPQAQ